MRLKVFILYFTVFLLFSFLPSTIIASEYDVDGNGVDDALTDGLLVLRHEFGLTGETLTAGALAPDATVTSPEGIANFINQRASVFDLDGNGSLDALTDGLLLLRHLFGLSGDAMINGVIGFGATRTSYDQIKSHIDTAGASDPLRFVYQTKCTTDYQGNEICFSEDDAGFQDVLVGGGSGGQAGQVSIRSTDYGTIKVQTIIDQWPDGEVFEDSDGNKSFSINTYDGYLQNRVPDGIDLIT